MRNSDAQLLHCAFAGASEALLGRVKKVLSRRQWKCFQSRLHSLGPIKLRDIEMAQQAIARSARKLMAAIE
jgi:flagellar motor switch protein FliG